LFYIIDYILIGSFLNKNSISFNCYLKRECYLIAREIIDKIIKSRERLNYNLFISEN